MSNRKADDVGMPRCPDTDSRGVCMYAGPCMTCIWNRAAMKNAQKPLAKVDKKDHRKD